MSFLWNDHSRPHLGVWQQRTKNWRRWHAPGMQANFSFAQSRNVACTMIFDNALALTTFGGYTLFNMPMFRLPIRLLTSDRSLCQLCDRPGEMHCCVTNLTRTIKLENNNLLDMYLKHVWQRLHIKAIYLSTLKVFFTLCKEHFQSCQPRVNLECKWDLIFFPNEPNGSHRPYKYLRTLSVKLLCTLVTVRAVISTIHEFF